MYIAFIILSKTLEAYVPQIHILNYFYFRLLACHFFSRSATGREAQNGATHSRSFDLVVELRLCSDNWQTMNYRIKKKTGKLVKAESGVKRRA
jgi:hypothetical protein